MTITKKMRLLFFFYTDLFSPSFSWILHQEVMMNQ